MKKKITLDLISETKSFVNQNGETVNYTEYSVYFGGVKHIIAPKRDSKALFEYLFNIQADEVK